MNDMLSLYRDDAESVFDESRFALGPRDPYEAFRFSGPGKTPVVSNYLIRNREQRAPRFGELTDPLLQQWVFRCLRHAESAGLPINDRYVHLSYLRGPSASAHTSGVQGWRIDGMQGQEVKIRKEACFQYLWCNDEAVSYPLNSFDLKAFLPKRYHIFNFLTDQVRSTDTLQPNITYLMNTYLPYQVEASGLCQLLRLSFSKLPITNTKMTLNPEMEYDHPVHTTTGTPPDSLI